MSELTYWEAAMMRAGIRGIKPGSGDTAPVEDTTAADEIASFHYQTPVVGHGVQNATNANTNHAFNERNVVRPDIRSMSAADIIAARQAEADAERARLAAIRNVNTGGIQQLPGHGDSSTPDRSFTGPVRQSTRVTGWGPR